MERFVELRGERIPAPPGARYYRQMYAGGEAGWIFSETEADRLRKLDPGILVPVESEGERCAGCGAPSGSMESGEGGGVWYCAACRELADATECGVCGSRYFPCNRCIG